MDPKVYLNSLVIARQIVRDLAVGIEPDERFGQITDQDGNKIDSPELAVRKAFIKFFKKSNPNFREDLFIQACERE